MSAAPTGSILIPPPVVKEAAGAVAPNMEVPYEGNHLDRLCCRIVERELGDSVARVTAALIRRGSSVAEPCRRGVI